jgi:hypothetical protein
MTQHRRWPTCQNSRHPSTFSSKGAVTDRVDAAMNGMEEPTRDPAAHSEPTDARIEELPVSNHAMLLCGSGRNHFVGVNV